MTTPTPAAGHLARIDARQLAVLVADVFVRLGVAESSARLAADALVAADLEGVASHGVMLLPMYVDRMRAGSVSPASVGTIVHDSGAAVTIDAGNALGQLTSAQAVALLIERAGRQGVAAVSVRNGFHFGMAGYWARQLADAGLIGMVLSNTRPLMPPPGAAERRVGNNPIAIAVPAAKGTPLVVDLALSATAMGRIRLAESAGRAIPEGWAADAEGNPTTDPLAAIKGMLLPAAGPKGFGLAVMVDLLCGGLSGGAIGSEVNPLYGDPADPYRCAHFFLAIDPAAFGVDAQFAERAAAFAQDIRAARPAAGVERVLAPGDLERLNATKSAGACTLASDVLDKLVACARLAGIEDAAARLAGAA